MLDSNRAQNKSEYFVAVFTKVLKLATYFIETFSFCDKEILKLEYLSWNGEYLWWILGIWSKVTAGLVACAFLEVYKYSFLAFDKFSLLVTWNLSKKTEKVFTKDCRKKEIKLLLDVRF